ncbi:MAG: aldehyde dehydrogenase family protein [Pseudomonadota bacterium]|nr:aldehyde dehydrogenase family protein [Pseudomonadota bacterium]
MLNELIWFPTNKCFIGGKWVSSSTAERIIIENPSSAEVLTEVAKGSAEDIDRAVTAAEKSLLNDWGQKTAAQRSNVLFKMSNLVLKYADKLAKLECLDVGKPLSQAKNDVIALARYLEFYGGSADKIHGITIPYGENFTVYTLRERLGITAHIIPWNYPMQIIGRSIGASLAMGNSCVLKPSEEACLTALAFGEIAREADLPPGALNIVPGYGIEAGVNLASHPKINHISFTGSFRVGSQVQECAAKNVVTTTLELGGKSPQIVFNDADVNKALPTLVNAGIQNAGQTCSASSRILVQRGIFEELVQKMTSRYNLLRVGPALEDLELGPLISLRQIERVIDFERNAQDIEKVAEGSILDPSGQNGFFLSPKLFVSENPNHILAQREIFGPIQVIIPFESEEEAISIANSTEYGLVASIWSANGARQMRLAKAIKAGQIFINNYGAGGGIELPFGGIGKSGHGREKGFEALYGFSQVKTVAANHE